MRRFIRSRTKRHELLPFLRLRFGDMIRPDLRRVTLAHHAFDEAIHDRPVLQVEYRTADGVRKDEDDCLGLHDDPAPADTPFHAAVLTYLGMDAIDWAHVEDIFRKDAVIPGAAAARPGS